MAKDLCPLEWPIEIVPFWIIAIGILFLGCFSLFFARIFRSEKPGKIGKSDVEVSGPLLSYTFSLIGIITILCFFALATAFYSYPIRRAIYEKFPFFGRVPKTWAIDVENESLSSIIERLGIRPGILISLGAGAADIKITGMYQGECGSELISNICEGNKTSLFCAENISQRTLFVCFKENAAECTSK